MRERFYISFRFKGKITIGSLKVNTANNVMLLFYILT